MWWQKYDPQSEWVAAGPGQGARLIVGVKNVARGTSWAGRTGPHAPYIYVKYISDAYSFSPKLMISWQKFVGYKWGMRCGVGWAGVQSIFGHGAVTGDTAALPTNAGCFRCP